MPSSRQQATSLDPADQNPETAPRECASLWPRFGAFVYDGVLLFGITFLASWVFTVLFGNATHGPLRIAYQSYLVAVAGVYFVYCWLRTGQTLAMKTWGLRVLQRSGRPLTLRLAVARYLIAVAGLFVLGLGFLWALVDRDRQFLHDRLLGTFIARTPAAGSV